MDELPKRRIWLPSPEVLVFLGVGVVVSALLLPGLRSSQRASNERNASTSLKTITSAEADFRVNDRDENGVSDFWTGDVSGLYYVQQPSLKKEIRLLEARVANADSEPLFPQRPSREPSHGYWFASLDRDASVKGPEGNYRLDTDKSGRKVHSPGKFGFCAWPVDSGEGKYVFYVNENNTIFREAGTQRKTVFPSDDRLRDTWSRGN